MTQTTEQLTARVRELEEENARLKAECDDIKQVQFPRKLEAVAVGWKKQLATSQAYAEQLRVALEDNFHFLERHSNRWDGVNGKHPNDVAESTRAILALPRDTSALDAYVEQNVKEAEERTGNKSPCYQIARDMAVRIWERHYKAESPNWVPLDDFMGVLSQISNMVAGLGNVAALTRQRDHLKMQAQHHAMEARIANATLNEIYQLVSGSTGEKANWNGAIPVREKLESLTRQRDLAVSELETVANGFDCDNDAHRYGSYCRKCEAKKALSTIKGEVKE